jgi:hypothetical protein
MIDAYQVRETERRFLERAAQRSRNERLIREGKLLRVDRPDRVQKFLARRGLICTTAGIESTRKIPFTADESGSYGEALERIIGTNDLMGVAFGARLKIRAV